MNRHSCPPPCICGYFGDTEGVREFCSVFPLYTSGSLPDAPFGLMLGCSIVPAEHCNSLGNKGDIVLADFREYLLIDKGGTEITPSLHVKFLVDEMAFRFIVRNNGQPVHDTPITPLNGTATLSPFLFLQDRS